MARNIRIDRSEAEFLTDLLLTSDNPMAKEIGDEIRDVFGMVSEEKEKQLTDNPKNFESIIAESNELIKKLGDVWATGIKDIYGKEYRVSDDQWNEEQLANTKESNTKPYEINKIKSINEIIKCQHLLVGSKVLENGDIMRKCLGCGIDMRSITLDGVFDALGNPCVIKPV